MQAIQAEMKKIEHKAQADAQSQYRKIKLQIQNENKGQKVNYKQIAERIKELE